MGSLTIKDIGGLGKSDNTLTEYDNEITEELLRHRLKQLTAVFKQHGDYVCYIFGMGGQPRSVYKMLEKQKGLEVIWCRSVLPKYLGILSFFVASFSGLVKVFDIDKLPDIFLALIEKSMAGIYFFPREGEQAFIESISVETSLKKNYDFTIKNDKRYFFYMVDADNYESATGIYEIVSYGVDAEKFSDCF